LHVSAGVAGSDTKSAEDEWLWGWDPTPGIVSVWAENTGHATIWRRVPDTGALVREQERFRPWILVKQLDDFRHLGAALSPESEPTGRVRYRELDGPGELRYCVSADSWTALTAALLTGASRRVARRVGHVRDLDDGDAHVLPPEEQYLVATGRTYFRDLDFAHLRRLQFDLETTGLDAEHDRMFLVAVRHPDGRVECLEARGDAPADEAALIRELVETVRRADPDVIERNLHLPAFRTRAREQASRSRWADSIIATWVSARRAVAREAAPMPRVACVSSRRGVNSSTPSMPCVATTFQRATFRRMDSRPSRDILASPGPIVNSSAAIRSTTPIASIRSACDAMRRPTWGKWRHSLR
jgi:hypothetical protein